MKSRPAETAGGLGAIATAVAFALGYDEATIAAVGVTAGALPSVVSLIVSNGGLRGCCGALWRGRA